MKNKMFIDKNYNIIDNDRTLVYKDRLLELTEELLKARDNGVINEREFKFLMKIVIKKDSNKELENSFSWLINRNRKTNILIKYSELEKKYA